MKKFLLLILVIFLIFFQTKAHVTITSSHEGKIYKPGELVTITWQMSVDHDSQNWDLLFSSDGGANWDTIQANIPIETLSYSWKVPETLTTEAILKVVQDNPAENYEDVSEIFTIATTTGIRELYTGKSTVYPNPFVDYAFIEFNNPEHKIHTLILYDIQGQLVRRINNINAERVILERKNLQNGQYVYILLAGQKVQAVGNLLIN